LGTALGDWVADGPLGYLGAAGIFGGALARRSDHAAGDAAAAAARNGHAAGAAGELTRRGEAHEKAATLEKSGRPFY